MNVQVSHLSLKQESFSLSFFDLSKAKGIDLLFAILNLGIELPEFVKTIKLFIAFILR